MRLADFILANIEPILAEWEAFARSVWPATATATDPRELLDHAPDLRDLDDLTRFNESVDQSLTEAVRSYTQRVDRSRQMFLAILGHDLRNPLNAVMMSAAVLSETPGLDADASGMASHIAASADA